VTRRTIRSVGIYPNFSKATCRQVFDDLAAWLIKENCRVYVSDDLGEKVSSEIHTVAMTELGAKIDLLIVLGGDGTLLASARALYPYEVPILGVNFGGLGFLTEVQVDSLYEAMVQTLRGDYTIEERMVLRSSIVDSSGKPRATVYGLNDAVLHETHQRLTEISMAIGEVKVGRFRADGMIVATPTGSTAYSLSAGGPVLEPLLDALIATPICPHTLAIRPLIFPAYETLRLNWKLEGGEITLVVDGQVYLEVKPDESLLVGRAERCTRFVHLRQRSFWDILSQKLKWGAGTTSSEGGGA